MFTDTQSGTILNIQAFNLDIIVAVSCSSILQDRLFKMQYLFGVKAHNVYDFH